MSQTRHQDFFHVYHSFHHPSVCHVRIIGDGAGTPIVLCSELVNNPGPSLTNTTRDLLVSLHCRLLGNPLLPIGVEPLFIEHYNCGVLFRDKKDGDTFDLIIDDGQLTGYRRVKLPILVGQTGYPVEFFLIPEHHLICPQDALREVDSIRLGR